VQRDGTATELYTYDSNGNCVTRQLGAAPTESAAFDGQDQLVLRGTLGYQFDADGYLTRRGVDTFVYSATGELLEATAAGQTVTYAYDGLRRRVSRTDGIGTTQYFYGNPDNDLQITHTRDAGGTLTTYYYDDAGRLFAMQRGAVRFYMATDQLGSPRVIADATGLVVRTLEYDAFGGITQDSDPGFELAIGFAGGLTDRVTGLVRFGVRDYEPAAGRWTARDQTIFGGTQANLYAYVNNNPVNLVDRSGLVSTGVTICEGVCVGTKFSFNGEGFSACTEFGFGIGNSLEFDPFGDLDKNGAALEGKFAGKLGIIKDEVGFEIGECRSYKEKMELCVGPFCKKIGSPDDLNNNKVKGKTGFEVKDIPSEAAGVPSQVSAKGKNPFKGAGIGVSGRFVGKVCQQVRW
jgi:RHS repeat-associated protein